MPDPVVMQEYTDVDVFIQAVGQGRVAWRVHVHIRGILMRCGALIKRAAAGTVPMARKCEHP
ncbi:hypothetical protein JCM25156A_12070 [Komagataeibacter kakiaceti JCM 25156]